MIDAKVLADVRRAATNVSGMLASPVYSQEDVEQSLLLRIVERGPRHEPQRASPRTLAALVVRHEAAAIVTKVLARKRGYFQCTKSLDERMACGDSAGMELRESLSADDYDGRAGRGCRSSVDALDLGVDVRRSVARLTPELAVVAHALMVEDRLGAVAVKCGTSRATLHRRMVQLRSALADAGLDQWVTGAGGANGSPVAVRRRPHGA